jgi:hypothetical protein
VVMSELDVIVIHIRAEHPLVYGGEVLHAV